MPGWMTLYLPFPSLSYSPYCRSISCCVEVTIRSALAMIFSSWSMRVPHFVLAVDLRFGHAALQEFGEFVAAHGMAGEDEKGASKAAASCIAT